MRNPSRRRLKVWYMSALGGWFLIVCQRCRRWRVLEASVHGGVAWESYPFKTRAEAVAHALLSVEQGYRRFSFATPDLLWALERSIGGVGRRARIPRLGDEPELSGHAMLNITFLVAGSTVDSTCTDGRLYLEHGQTTWTVEEGNADNL